MFRLLAILTLAAVCSTEAGAQGILSDVLAGKLVKPKVGQWAWYNLRDTKANRRYLLRQAIVGQEKVKRKTGNWVEVELIPDVGFPTIYKMLLTGPASDPKNIHRILLKAGEDPLMELSVEEGGLGDGKQEKTKRVTVGEVDVETPAGVLKADHIIVTGASETIELWLNDEIRPMGIVRMRTSTGELMLQAYGTEGPHGESKLGLEAERSPVEKSTRGPRVEFDALEVKERELLDAAESEAKP
ncbi:MAG: hypothetical protein QGG73_05205 [Candidatus Hydrogenedentes bacterium]|jgi:hypothetical protein|nr:hypothetical protein [Candidatus Hydrogenedentota bacterium]